MRRLFALILAAFLLCTGCAAAEQAQKAPDFILEVISPSSVRKDAVIKMRKYKEAGVREFWLIDPKEKVLFVYDLENEQGNVVYLYSFNEKVPVRIWNGALEIDLVDMYQSIEWLYERRM